MLFGTKTQEIKKEKSLPNIADGCRCYAKGTSYSAGMRECLGGYQAIYVSTRGVGDESEYCGWVHLRDRQGYNISCAD